MSLLDNAINTIPNISVIAQIELLCWETDNTTQQQVKNFISDSNVLGVTPEVIDQCVEIRIGRKIKTPDAIISAMAGTHGYTVITNNEKDLGNIKRLKILNAHKI